VSNFHSSVSTATASQAISDALAGTFTDDNILIKTVPGAVKSASLRFKTTNPEEVEAITAALSKVSVGSYYFLLLFLLYFTGNLKETLDQ
jgi:6,7-dimethyl-8-ribityllumazine synthase